jgi:hypothetical protein
MTANEKPDQCAFDEPWIGRCRNQATGYNGSEGWLDYAGACCEKHRAEKCVVCGRQALTRCMASIGVMCGRPLCDLCGKGEMCDAHASTGPLKLIADLRRQLKAATTPTL